MTKPTWTSDCGTVRLWLGDCLEVVESWPDGAVDAVVTDPPYGITVGAAFVRTGGREVHNGSGGYNEGASWQWLADPSWLIDGGNIAAFHKRGDSLPGWVQTWHRFYLVKDAPPTTPRPVFVSAVEECSIGRKPGKPRWFGGGYCINYWRGLTPNRLNRSHGHPTEKPLDAMEMLIGPLTDRGDTIADPFMGSGTTGVAAIRLGRQFWGVEIDPQYFEIAKRRIKDELRRVAFLEGNSDGRPRQLTMLEETA